MKLVLNGEAVDLDKEARRITIWQYLELEDETGITADQLQNIGTAVSSTKALAAFAFLIRRHRGEQVTFREAAEQLTPEDIIGDDDPETAADPTSAPTDSDRGDAPAEPAPPG